MGSHGDADRLEERECRLVGGQPSGKRQRLNAERFSRRLSSVVGAVPGLRQLPEPSAGSPIVDLI